MAPSKWLCISLLILFSITSVRAFQSDELSEDDDEWGIVGSSSKPSQKPSPATAAAPLKSSSADNSKRVTPPSVSADKKVQFVLEHSFGGSDFVPAGVFTVRARESPKGGQTLSKFRLARDPFSSQDKEKFQALLDNDDLYSIRVPFNVLNPGNSFAVSSIKARCLEASNFQERFDFQMDHGFVLGVSYSGSTSCPYPRALKTPSHWKFDSLIIVKSAEQAAARSSLLPQIVELLPEDETLADDGTVVKKLPEKTFWAKYWMYIVPLGLVVVNAITQVANMPEEGAEPQRVAAGGGGGGGGPRRR